MTDTAAPVWGVWSNDWIQRETLAERPELKGLNGQIVTLDHPDGRRETWKVAGGELAETPTRLCGICREKPVGPGGQMCPECFARIDHKGKTDPYGMGG
ncbi:hypothetical protein IRT45_34925 [Nocardia sp. BSTN01]|uniref:hypothetical protein n=1 Tax=Nocardia sp. BSTN01 TaxID=2783665 RepID=UPI00188F3F04|nr:hypothetical protein [Nocardia sp. BSTN01]MBF5002314.1 hypothetical protein [Nocardia sp. BSTN01]